MILTIEQRQRTHGRLDSLDMQILIDYINATLSNSGLSYSGTIQNLHG
jgi:hypothetical protein